MLLVPVEIKTHNIYDFKTEYLVPVPSKKTQ